MNQAVVTGLEEFVSAEGNERDAPRDRAAPDHVNLITRERTDSRSSWACDHVDYRIGILIAYDRKDIMFSVVVHQCIDHLRWL